MSQNQTYYTIFYCKMCGNPIDSVEINGCPCGSTEFITKFDRIKI